MPKLTVIVPTYNEAGNVRELHARLDAVLAGVDWEVLFVDDDSPDDTARRVAELAQQDPRVRSLLRIGRRGLSSASGPDACARATSTGTSTVSPARTRA